MENTIDLRAIVLTSLFMLASIFTFLFTVMMSEHHKDEFELNVIGIEKKSIKEKIYTAYSYIMMIISNLMYFGFIGYLLMFMLYLSKESSGHLGLALMTISIIEIIRDIIKLVRIHYKGRSYTEKFYECEKYQCDGYVYEGNDKEGNVYEYINILNHVAILILLYGGIKS